MTLAAYGVQQEEMPPSTTILAFDPGGTTGWCRGTFDPETSIIYDLEMGQLEKPEHHGAIGTIIHSALSINPHLMVVTEDYRPEFARAQNMIALEYIGVMRYVCKKALIPFARQGREIKGFWTSQRLRQIGFWQKNSPHAQDAARHWLAYACKQDMGVEVELMDKIRTH